MFEELNAHRQAVQENIKKAFEVGFTGNEDLEKAHQVGDIHPNGKLVWTQLPSGKYDWRVIKNKQGNNSVKSSSSEQAVDISKIPDKEFKRITNMLEKQNPLAKDAPRYLEEEAMSDSELKNFLACAEHFKNDTKNINQLTRQRCSEWAKLAKSELDDRRQSKKDEKTKNKDSGAKATNSGLTEQEKREKSLLESAARSGHRLLQRDAHRLDVLQRKERQAAASAKAKLDTTTIDQAEYDKAYKTATSATETEEHLKSSLAKIEENIKTIKDAFANASDATAGKLQKMLTASVSKKKAIEDALKS